MSARLSKPTADDVRFVAVDAIDIPPGRRRLDPAWVAAIEADFVERGQLSPVEVVEQGERFRLVFGAHRVAAATACNWREIRAVVRQPEEFQAEADLVLREIAENLVRRKLSALDRAVDIARWRDIYEAAHGPVKAHRPQKLFQVGTISDDVDERFAASFSEAARMALGVGRTSIFRSIRIARIPAELRDRIALLPVADNQSELLLLAAEPAFRQHDIVNLLTAETPARSVGAAIELLDGKPVPEVQPWQKVADRFSGLKERDQDRFFSLHEGAVRLWLERRAIRIVEGDGGAE